MIVSTAHAFRREDAELLKVYASSGAPMHHSDGLAAELLAAGEGAKQALPYSLAKVLRLRRPVVIVDDVHTRRS